MRLRHLRDIVARVDLTLRRLRRRGELEVRPTYGTMIVDHQMR